MRLSREILCLFICISIRQRRKFVCGVGWWRSFYDDLERMCTVAIELTPGGPNDAINIPSGQRNTVRVLESGTVLLECKDGPYEPLGEEDILL